MSIEKLQKVATTPVSASVKARWLNFWNSPIEVKSMNKFPSTFPIREKVFDEWLNRASFWGPVILLIPSFSLILPHMIL